MTHNIRLFSLLQTKIKASSPGDFYLTVCPQWCIITNNSWHGNGRIIIGLHPSAVNVNIICCTVRIIHIEVGVINGGKKFFCTFVYGMNDRHNREEMWSSLKQNNVFDFLWIILGDFNAIMHMEDRIGHLVRERDLLDMKGLYGRM